MQRAKRETESLRNYDATKEILRCIGACAVLVAAPSQYAPHPNAVCVYLLEVRDCTLAGLAR